MSKWFIFAGLIVACGLQAIEVERYDSRSDQVIPKEAYIEKLADGFAWVEGLVITQIFKI